MKEPITRSKIHTAVTVSAAHFVHTDCKSKCYRLHGHTWKVEVIMNGGIGEDGMVVDFNTIKKIVNEVDHKIIVPECLIHGTAKKSYNIWKGGSNYTIPKDDVFVLPREYPASTSEWMAKYFRDRIWKVWKNKVDPRLISTLQVIVWEGPESWAQAGGE